MKRTLLLMLAALAAAFVAYLGASVLLPDPDVVRRDDDAGSDFDLPRSTADGEGIGPSEDVQFRIFDPETNQPVAQIQIGRYRRLGERTVGLTDVRVTVTVDGGAAAVIESPGGTVEVEPPASGRREQIDADALANALASGPPTATLAVDNLIFDYARYVLRTGDTTVNEQTILADDVPVRVESDDYVFVGYGLTLEWDPDAGRPELLRVARGESITFLTPPALLDGSPTAAAPLPGSALATSTLTAAMVQAEPPMAEEDVAPYAVTLVDDLKAKQGEETLLTGDAATLYVPLAFRDEEPEAAPQPRRRPRRRSADRAPQPEADPEPPLVVTWSGPLTMVPAPPEITLADREDSKAELVGTPLVAHTDNGTITAGRLWFEQAADVLEIDGHAGAPVVFADADGNTLRAPRVVAAPDAGTATALGAGSATLAGEGDAGATELAWSDRCDFAFEEIGTGDDAQTVLRQIDAVGDVEVAAKTLALSSQTLSITLGDPPADASEPTPIEAVKAAGDVYCLVNAGGADEATFDAETLWLAFPEGPDGPIDATAEGDVVAVQADGILRGDRLTATIGTDDAGEQELRRLRVEGDVVATDPDGQTVRGIVATLDGAGRPLVVVGGDAGPATVDAAMGESAVRINAPSVVLDPADKSLATRDGGDLLARQTDESGSVGESRLAWAGTFTATGERVDVTGDVVASGPLQDGASFDLSADSVGVSLPPSAEGDPATRPGSTAMLADVERVDLAGAVRLTVTQPGESSGRRTFDLRAERLTALPATEAVEVPVPGRALHRDDRPEPPPGEKGGNAFRGNAAVGWSTRLVFDPEGDRLRITGDATIAIEPVDEKPFRIIGDTLDVFFARDGEERQIERATVEGNVVVTPDAAGQARRTIVADRATYDPAAQTLLAVGTDGRSVRVLDANGVPIGQFDRVIYDVETGQIAEMTGVRTGR